MEGNQRARVTVMLSCTADGTLLDPCIVEASKSKAACSKAGSTRYQRDEGITVWKQENNTVNSSIMVDWINNWLVPLFAPTRAKGERLLLIIDSARGHMTKEVKEACKRNDIDICMIPGGCTGILQPLDLTVNRSFKARLKRGYARAMRGYPTTTARKEPKSKLNMRYLVENVLQSAQGVTGDCVRNGWRRMRESEAQ